MLQIALPNKGRLARGARDLLEKAGLDFEMTHSRSLQARLGHDVHALFARAEDIPGLVAGGAATVGITGRDLLEEKCQEATEVLDLSFGKCRVAFAVRDDHPVRCLNDLPTSLRIASSFPTLATRFLSPFVNELHVVAISGAAEIAPHFGLADGIVDLVSTGSTLKLNGLREVTSFLESSAIVITRPGDQEDQEVSNLLDALRSVLFAKDKRYLMTNIPKKSLDALRRVLPGLSGPTIVEVMNSGHMVGAHAVVDRREVYQVISQLKALGAEGILVTDIERLMP